LLPSQRNIKKKCSEIIYKVPQCFRQKNLEADKYISGAELTCKALCVCSVDDIHVEWCV
jgi:hypothetical protein